MTTKTPICYCQYRIDESFDKVIDLLQIDITIDEVHSQVSVKRSTTELVGTSSAPDVSTSSVVDLLTKVLQKPAPTVDQ